MKSLRETEVLAFQLASIYLRYYKQVSPARHFSLHSVKNTKWWNYFVTAIQKYGEREDFNMDQFVKAQFEEYGKAMPFHFILRDAYDIYLARRKLASYDRTETAKSIAYVYQAIKKWSLQNGYEKANIKAFLQEPKNIMLLRQDFYDITLFSVSKTFRELNKEKHIVNEAVLDIKRSLIVTDKKIHTKLKEILQDEFY